MLTAKSVLFKKLNFSVKDCVIVGKHEAELRKEGSEIKTTVAAVVEILFFIFFIFAFVIAAIHLLDSIYPNISPSFPSNFLWIGGAALILLGCAKIYMDIVAFHFSPCTESEYEFLIQAKKANKLVEGYIDAVVKSGRNWLSNCEYLELRAEASRSGWTGCEVNRKQTMGDFNP